MVYMTNKNNKGVCIMKLNPICNNQISFQSQFKPTNALRLSLIEGQRTSNKTLLKSMNKLLNDGIDRTFEINVFLRSFLGERSFYKIETEILGIGTYGKSCPGSENVEKDIVKEVRNAIKLFAGDLSSESYIDKMTKKEISKELKNIEQNIFKEEIYKY